MTQTNVFAHKMVADLCVHMAHDLYQELVTNNKWYKANPDETAYVNRVAPTLVSEARQILGSMLNDTNLSPDQKEEICEALVKDNGLPDSHTRGVFPYANIPAW
jgi:hypothetical protein